MGLMITRLYFSAIAHVENLLCVGKKYEPLDEDPCYFDLPPGPPVLKRSDASSYYALNLPPEDLRDDSTDFIIRKYVEKVYGFDDLPELEDMRPISQTPTIEINS